MDVDEKLLKITDRATFRKERAFLPTKHSQVYYIRHTKKTGNRKPKQANQAQNQTEK